jgi:hypothetical protein
MDPFDERILRALSGGKPRDFHQILMEVDFSHNTLRLHLNNLVERGLIIREKTPTGGLGRPKFTYSVSQGPGSGASGAITGSSDVVTLPFRRLRRLCRFQRGGRCRETKGQCEALNCPQIQKNE